MKEWVWKVESCERESEKKKKKKKKEEPPFLPASLFSASRITFLFFTALIIQFFVIKLISKNTHFVFVRLLHRRRLKISSNLHIRVWWLLASVFLFWVSFCPRIGTERGGSEKGKGDIFSNGS